MDKILFVDFMNALWRASSISFKPKKASSKDNWAGENIKEEKEINQEYVQVFNFFRNLRPLIEQFSPAKCFMVLEGHPKFRYDLYADYKANRFIKYASASNKEQQEKLLKTKDEVLRLLKHFPITIAQTSSYEADDLVATFCDNLKSENLTIISNDSDYIQLLQRGYPNCKIYNPIKKVFMEAPPYPYVAWKALNGDKSDNIPALLKPKKAIDTISNPEVFKKFLEVEENRANFSINRQLIEFRSVPLEEIILQDGVKNFELVKQEFARMEFQSIINENSWKKYTSTFNCLRF